MLDVVLVLVVTFSSELLVDEDDVLFCFAATSTFAVNWPFVNVAVAAVSVAEKVTGMLTCAETFSLISTSICRSLIWYVPTFLPSVLTNVSNTPGIINTSESSLICSLFFSELVLFKLKFNSAVFSPVDLAVISVTTVDTSTAATWRTGTNNWDTKLNIIKTT